MAQRSVVLVTVDTTRPDRLGAYGATDVATPVLDRLASRGVVFEQAWASAPITLVAHTSILTGLNPFEHGVRNNGTQYVPEDLTTLAEHFGGLGYHTGAFVSAAVLDRRYGLEQGFDVYDDDLSERRNLSPRMVADRPAEVTISAASKWVEQLPDDDNFFLWVHLYDPHASYSPPPPYRDTYRERLYDGEIAYMDAQIGELFKSPRVLGTPGDTDDPIVMVIGDHGESLGEHGERTHAILAYDSTLHVPWIVHVPGGPGGRRVVEPVGQVDLAPTLLALVGSESSTAMSGRNLVPVMAGRQSEPQRVYYSETYLPFYTYGWAKLRVLHKGRWKWIEAPQPELYDRKRDPRELSNLAEQNTDVAYDMKRDLGEWLASGETDREASLDLDSEAVAQLRALGYLAVSAGASQRPDDEERPNPMVMIEQHVGLERSRMLLADDLFAAAERQLTGVLRKDPRNLAALIDLVRALEGQGKVEEALQRAERALEIDPDSTQTYMLLARLEAAGGDVEKALEVAQIAASKDPNNPELAIQTAGFLQRLGRRQAVISTLEAALAEHPEHPRTNAVFAHWVEARAGRADDAEARLRSALSRDPYLDQGWLFLGRLLEQNGRGPEAEESYRRGLRARPDNAELHGALGHYLARRGQFADAEAQLQEAVRLSREFKSELHVSLGALYSETGQLQKARSEYDKVLDRNPKHPGARNNAAIALFRAGEADGAIAKLRELISEHPQHIDANNNLAALYVETERWSEALRAAEETLELAPGLVEAWNNKGIALDNLGREQAARAAYEDALALAGDYLPALFNLGVLIKGTDPAGAASRFEQVLELAPGHPEGHLELGHLYAGPMGNPAKARVHWNAFLRHAPPEHPERRTVRQALLDL